MPPYGRHVKGEPFNRLKLTERLVALILAVQAGPIPSLKVLAETHGVCERTIRRDLAVIECAMPVHRARRAA